jgi:ATP-dependent helicase HrpB
MGLNWLDPPPLPAWREAVGLLRDVQALDATGRITPHGQSLSAFGLPPRLAHMIVAAGERGFGTTAAWVAAVLSERGLGGNHVDVAERLTNLKRDNSQRASKARGQAQGWAKQIGAHEPMNPEDAGRALALAFPERVAKARDRRGGYLLRNGRGGEMPSDERLSTSNFLAVGALQGRAQNARISEAASLSRPDLEDFFGDQIVSHTLTTFDKASGTVRGRHQKRLGALVLDETNAKLTPDQVGAGLLEAVRTHGLSLLEWSQRANLLRGRVAWLRAQDPETWPDMSDAALLDRLEDWMSPALIGVTKISDVDVTQALMSLLDWPTSQRLVQEAPERFETPAGTTHAIDYSPDQGPTVDVRVQELFGLTIHPKLAGGKIPLVFQLLSPAHRPIAVTSDVPGFWQGAWADVRKDMKARYPRHVWPDDPSSAAPTTRAKPRGT